MRCVRRTMSLALSHSADDIRRCLKARPSTDHPPLNRFISRDLAFCQAAARIDLARARLFLGEDMEGEACTSTVFCSYLSPAFKIFFLDRCPRLEMMES